jgi:hypothetical protein
LTKFSVMKIKQLIPAILLLTSLLSFSQKKIKYKTVYFEDNTVETPNAKVSLLDVIAEDNLITGTLKIENHTGKPLVIKPEECSYTLPAGEVFSKKKWLVVAPRQNESKTIDVKGENMKTKETLFKIGGFYICNSSEIAVAPNAVLPPEKEINVGSFKLELVDWSKTGPEIRIRYIVTYLGDKVGLLDPSLVTIKATTGEEYKNQKDDYELLAFHKKENYTVDFVFVNDAKTKNSILWNKAFSEGVPEKLGAVSFLVKMDEKKTKEKDKK